jgi:hypothetical protein
MIFLMGCGDRDTSQSGTAVSSDSVSENYSTDRSSEGKLESDTESCSHSEESSVISDMNEDNSNILINSEVEIDFSEFE